MRALMMPLLVCVATVVFGGCNAASFSGELDGKPVDSFFSAAFGRADANLIITTAHVVLGIFAPGDSCQDGAEYLKLDRRRREENNDADRRRRADDLADFMNDKIPEGRWYGFVTINAVDDDDLDRADFAFDGGNNQDVRSVELQLCQRDGTFKEQDGNVIDNNDCFIARRGDVEIDRSDDEDTVFIRSDGDVEFHNVASGDDEGDLTFDMSLSLCEDMTGEVRKLTGQ